LFVPCPKILKEDLGRSRASARVLLETNALADLAIAFGQNGARNEQKARIPVLYGRGRCHVARDDGREPRLKRGNTRGGNVESAKPKVSRIVAPPLLRRLISSLIDEAADEERLTGFKS